MSADLAGRMRPIIRNPDISTDLTNHVVDGSLGGIFHYFAKEEAATRNDPVARTTELVRRVFGR